MLGSIAPSGLLGLVGAMLVGCAAGGPAPTASAAKASASATPAAAGPVAAVVSHGRSFRALPGGADLHAEDVAYDEETRTFYVASTSRRAIVAVDAAGATRDFVTPGAAGIGSVCALGIAGDRLYAASAELPEMQGYRDAAPHPTALYVFALHTAAPLGKVALPDDGKPHALTDMTVAANGTIYVSDSSGGQVYRLPVGGRALEALTAPGQLGSPQTPALSADGHHLYIADYDNGIARLDLDTRALSLLEAPGMELRGIDGLYRHEGELLAVQNGTRTPRIMRLRLDPSGSRVVVREVLEQRTAAVSEPNHGVLVKDTFYFLASTPPAIWALPLTDGTGT